VKYSWAFMDGDCLKSVEEEKKKIFDADLGTFFYDFSM
jgi:hypothetical protein